MRGNFLVHLVKLKILQTKYCSLKKITEDNNYKNLVESMRTEETNKDIKLIEVNFNEIQSKTSIISSNFSITIDRSEISALNNTQGNLKSQE